MDELIRLCEQDVQDIEKSLVENTAATAYNEVVFESAIDYLLNEAPKAETRGAAKKDEKKDDKAADDKAEESSDGKKRAGFKNTLYKAWETLKRMAIQLFNKLKNVLNQFIAKAQEGKIDKLIANNKDKMVTQDKDLRLGDKVHYMFGLDEDEFKSGSDFDWPSEEKFVARVISSLDFPEWATSDLNKIKSIKALNAYVASAVSKAPEKKSTMSVGEYFGSNGFKGQVTTAKNEYNKIIKQVNGFIADLKKDIDKNDEKGTESIKNCIANANKYLTFVYASYSGYLKWTLAFLKQGIKGIKKSTEPKNESVLEDFYGLSLL